jgi:uncharacterized membrane protein
VTLHPTAATGALLAVSGTVLILLTRQGTAAGALAGLAVALLAVLGLGAGAFFPLAIFVLGSGMLTRLGRGRKEGMGAAEPDQGRRGAAHVAAKLSLPAATGLLALLGAAPERALALVYAASLAGAFADTAATELGPVIGGPAFGLRGGRITGLPHGTPGGMSVAGFGAAAGAAAAVAGGAWSVRLLDSAPAAGIAAGAGFLASALESLLAGTAWGTRVGHFGRNVFLSVASAGLAVWARALGWSGS